MKNRSIKQMFRKKKLPDEAWEYIDDLRLHVFQMRNLPEDVRSKFTSDMRIVVDYLADEQSITNSKHPVKHFKELCDMLYCLSDDVRYLRIWEQKVKENAGNIEKEGQITMCKVLDEYWNGGVAQGKIEDIIILLENMGVLSKQLKEKIIQEKDIGILNQWFLWAVKAGSIEEFEMNLQPVCR